MEGLMVVGVGRIVLNMDMDGRMVGVILELNSGIISENLEFGLKEERVLVLWFTERPILGP